MKLSSPRTAAWGVTAAAALILLLAMGYSSGGGVDIESPGFLLHYLAPRSFWAAIFDPYRNDWGLYQARELSYAFDWIDARLIGFWLRHGVIIFYSVTNWVMLVTVVGLQQYGWRSLFPEMKSRVSTLLSLWFILLPCCTNNAFFRSAKYGCALLFTAVAFLSWSLIVRPPAGVRERRGRVAAIVVLLVLVQWFDRQGAFFTAAYTVGVGCLLLVSQRLRLQSGGDENGDRDNGKLLRALAFGGMGAVLFGAIYNLWLAPYLIFRLNGYHPDFSYQNLGNLPWFELLPGGSRFLGANAAFALTGTLNLYGGILLPAGIGVPFFLCWHRKRDGRALLAGGAFLFTLAAMWAAASVMAGRHPPLLLPQVMTSTYFLPFWALLIVFAGGAAEALRRSGVRFPLMEAFAVTGIVVHLALIVLPGSFPAGRLQRPEFPPEVHLLRHALKHSDYDYRRDLLPPRSERLIEWQRASGERNRPPLQR